MPYFTVIYRRFRERNTRSVDHENGAVHTPGQNARLGRNGFEFTGLLGTIPLPVDYNATGVDRFMLHFTFFFNVWV